MGSRRAGRELALQALYQLDMTESEDPRELGLFWSYFDRPAEVQAFAQELVDGTLRQRERIDKLIAESAEHWRLPRLSKVDLNLLRLATYELLDRPEIPSSVTLNEAVEIARRFGSDDSASFVNGVLDHIAGVLGVKGRERPVE
ncbi:MAG: transcription antitermination factor NusB [Candidatus Binatia bacterium]